MRDVEPVALLDREVAQEELAVARLVEHGHLDRVQARRAARPRPTKLPFGSTGTGEPASQTLCAGGIPLPCTCTVPVLPSGMLRASGPGLAVAGEQRIERRLGGRGAGAGAGGRLGVHHPERLRRRLVEVTLRVVGAQHVLQLAHRPGERLRSGLPLRASRPDRSATIASGSPCTDCACSKIRTSERSMKGQ